MTRNIGIINSDDEEGATPSRAQRKREEKAARRAESAAKKAEARRLAELEEIELNKSVAARRSKVTAADLLRRREEVSAAQRREEERRKKEMSRSLDEKEYRSIVCVANTNRVGSDIDARNVDEALAQLTLHEDRFPERRAIVLFQDFEKKELERLKQEKPGLTLKQYRVAVFKLWKRSPDYRDVGSPNLSQIGIRKGHSRSKGAYYKYITLYDELHTLDDF